ncbi:MAG: amidohydrolase family protein [Candidatus Bathyarchaeia archaeon]
MIADVNAFLGDWPFRSLRGDVNSLLKLMAKCKVDVAFVSSLNAIFYKDLEEANLRLWHNLKGVRALIGVCTINPSFPESIEHLDKCVSEMGMVGVKIHPNYHGYSLEDNSVNQFFEECSKKDVPVIVPLRIQDERIHHPSSKVPPIPVAQIISTAKRNPSLKVIVCNARSNEINEIFTKANDLKNLYVVFSWVQSLNFIEKMVKKVGCDRMLWGSNFPLNYIEPTLHQIIESNIENSEKEKILSENAKKIFLR